MKELWKPVKGYETIYMISNKGRIKTVSRYIVYRKGTAAVFVKGRILNPVVNKRGYVHIRLNDKKDYSIHRLVALAFIDNPDNLPTIDHIDGNKQNNRVDNLEWVTYKENNQRAYDLGLKHRIHAGQFIDGRNRRL